MLLPAFIRAAVFVFATVMPTRCAPFIPESESQVVEHLPFAADDPVMRELSALRGQLNKDPENLPLALHLARRYLELGRVTGDPRYGGVCSGGARPLVGSQPTARGSSDFARNLAPARAPV